MMSEERMETEKRKEPIVNKNRKKKRIVADIVRDEQVIIEDAKNCIAREE